MFCQKYVPIPPLKASQTDPTNYYSLDHLFPFTGVRLHVQAYEGTMKLRPFTPLSHTSYLNGSGTYHGHGAFTLIN